VKTEVLSQVYQLESKVVLMINVGGVESIFSIFSLALKETFQALSTVLKQIYFHTLDSVRFIVAHAL